MHKTTIVFYGESSDYENCVASLTSFTNIKVYHDHANITPQIIINDRFQNLISVSYNHWHLGIKMFNERRNTLINTKNYVVAATSKTYKYIPELLDRPVNHSYQTLFTIKSSSSVYDLYMCDYITFMKVTLFWKRISSIEDKKIKNKFIDHYILPVVNDNIETEIWNQWLDQLNITLINCR